MTVRADWNQVALRVNCIFLSDFSERYNMVNMDIASAHSSVGLFEIEPADGADAPVMRNA